MMKIKRSIYIMVSAVFILMSAACSNQSPRENAFMDSTESKKYVHRVSDEATKRIDEARKKAKYGWGKVNNNFTDKGKY